MVSILLNLDLQTLQPKESLTSFPILSIVFAIRSTIIHQRRGPFPLILLQITNYISREELSFRI